MPRRREGVLAEYGGGAVYVKPSRKGSGFSIFANGREYSRMTLKEATLLGAELGRRYAVVNGGTPLITVLDRLFGEERPEKWSQSYLEALRDVSEFFRPDFGVAAGDLTFKHADAAIMRVRAAGLGPSTENQVRNLWSAVTRWCKDHEAMAETTRTRPSKERRPAPKVRKASTTQGESAVFSRDRLMTWEQLRVQAAAAAEYTGRWWEELRILFLALVGCRWGEHASLIGEDFDLDSGVVYIAWTMRETRSHMWELDHTKTDTVRDTVWPSFLDEMLERRIAEVGPWELVFPGVEPAKRRKANRGLPMLGPANWQDGLDEETLRSLTETRHGGPIPTARTDVVGTWASRWWYRPIWQHSGLAAGYPVKSYVATVDGKVSSLLWSPHYLRHWCATWLINPKDPDPALWYEGAGVSMVDAAAAIGDSLETFRTHYLGSSDATLRRIRLAMRG